MTKPTKWHTMRPVKTQISLGMASAQSDQSLRCALSSAQSDQSLRCALNSAQSDQSLRCALNG